MTRDHWQRIEGLFYSAVDLAPGDRAEFLRESCGGDTELLRQVEELIASETQSICFLEDALRSAAADMTKPRSVERLGAYRVISELGRGGMGVVYLAERDDEQFRMRVAIKLIRSDAAPRRLLPRFRSERQILATLDHPNIARLLDGGAAGDAPYFVMEYVAGQPIDRYCRERDVPVATRLRLFLQVCDAIAYAHRKLIIHRDIKPGNTLVTDEGLVKLLDFGIAKILPGGESGESPLTAVTDALLTPEYASPEQLRGERLTVASDIYSLGVLLYELLGGAYPFAGYRTSPLKLQKAICEQEPPRPSSIGSANGSISPELDAITLKAMRKEPGSRYPSVDALAEDIRRHLSGYPVIAATDSWQYRTEKFVRRNKWAVGAGLAAAVLLVAWGASLRAEQARTMKRSAQVREMATGLLFELHDAIRDLPGSIAARKLVVERGVRYLDELANDAPHDPSLQAELADGYLRIADIQNHPGLPSLRDIPGAIQSIRKANTLREQLLRESPSVEQRIKLALGLGRLADSLDEISKNPAEYETIGRKGLDILAGLPPGIQAREDAAGETAALQFGLGVKRLAAGDPGAAAEYFRRSITLRERLFRQDPQGADLQLNLAWSYLLLADSLGGVLTKINLKKPQEALVWYSKAQNLFEDLIRRRPNDVRSQTLLAAAYLKESVVMRFQGQAKPADILQDNALTWFRAAAAADPNDRETRRYLGIIYNDIGQTRLGLRDFRAARLAIEQSIRIREALLREQPADRQAQQDLASVEQSYAQFWLDSGRPGQAETESRKAIQLRAPLFEQDPANAAIRVRQANAYGILGRALLAERQWSACRDALTTSLSYFEPVEKAGSLSVEYAEIPGKIRKSFGTCSSQAPTP